MFWADGDDCLCLCLIDIWYLVEEHQGELVVTEGNLDHIAIDRIEISGDINGNFLLAHANLLAEWMQKPLCTMLPPSSARRPEFIPISTLVRASACPVRVYLERHDPIQEPYEYTVAKQVGYHLGGNLDVDTIWREITLVRPDISVTMQGYLRGCISACAGLPWRPPRTIDLTITNRRYAVSGRIDWFFDTEPKIGILRATRAPDHGVWRQDRLRAAGYLLAAEELDGETVSEVQIAYLPSGIVRRVIPNASDRRTLLSALKSVEAIYRGETPRSPPNAPCDRCGKKDLCNKEPPTLFERFFKR